MIGKLKGFIEAIGEDWVLIDINGVGYEVYCPATTLRRLGRVGEAVELSIETHVRETEIKLFGFGDEISREWFRKLQSVQGVGAKVAIAILGALSPSELTNAISLQDKALVTKAPGVGPKVAARIVSELKDKVPALPVLTSAGLSRNGGDGESAPGRSVASDAVSALTNLGYQSTEASLVVAGVFQTLEGEPSVEELIRLSLKELTK